MLDEHEPSDAMAVYYAFYYPEQKTTVTTYPIKAEAGEAVGYVNMSRTGIDLFRPFVTLRLPIEDLDASVDLIYSAMRPGTAVILHAPGQYLPLLRALFEIHTEEHQRLFVLERNRFQPIINVLVTREESHNKLARYVIRHNTGNSVEIVASAGLNWQTPRFAEIAVNTDPSYRHRGWGSSVVSAMVQHLIQNGRMPLYVVLENNRASIRLAHSVGFVDSGIQNVMIQGALKPRL